MKFAKDAIVKMEEERNPVVQRKKKARLAAEEKST